MEEAIRTRLLAVTAVTDIVAARINWGVHPQGEALPGLVLTTVSDAQDSNLNAPSGISDARVQVDCYAEDYGAAKLLFRAVRGALSGWSSHIAGIQGVFEENARDGFLGETQDGDRPFRVSVDFRVVYSV
ncbi:MAG: DUF3168 domain-containing protein [Pseudomonadota bacterium]